MQISKSYDYNTNFNGNVHFLTDTGTVAIKNAIINHPLVDRLINEGKDLYVKISYREASKSEIINGQDSELYKITFKAVKECKNTLLHWLNSVTSGKHCLSKSYHSESGNLTMLKTRSDDIEKYFFG